MAPPPRLGLRPNAAQFTLLVVINALVGGMVGQQQTTLPLLAEQVFSLRGYSWVFAYVAAFGVSKAASNYLAGLLSDRYGRKPVLLTGWLFGLPVPLLIMWAPSWEWIIAANILLGLNQGLAWTTTVTMKIDLVGPRQRGLAMGLNEAAGYLAVSLTSLTAGWIAAQHGLRPAPFLLGVAYAVLALVLVAFFVRETRGFVALEAPAPAPARSNAGIIADVTWRHPALSSASVAGMANNLNFGLSWGVFPLLFAGAGLGLREIGLLVALYPLVWGCGQLATGWISDHVGRRPLVVGGMALLAEAL
ncbi:MFS transporter, partial [Corynebacterium nasicanis]